MFKQIVFSSVVSGLVAGMLITVIQLVTVIPMVFEAETYETAGSSAQGVIIYAINKSAQGSATQGTVQVHDSSHGHAEGDHHHGANEWAPEDGFERNFYTTMTNVLAAIGFALFLTICYLFVGNIDWRKGLLWGLGGFVVFQLAPALGLPPELPGTEAASVSARQLWWVATVLATSAGLLLLVFNSSSLFKIAGMLLISLPHLIGAPQPEIHSALAPPELTTNFIMVTMMVGCVFWVMLGGLTGYTFLKFK